MSWLKGLAGKAEDLLNQIDQNAAVAFQNGKDKDYGKRDDMLIEVTWDTPSSSGRSSELKTPIESSTDKQDIMLLKMPSPKRLPVKDTDEELIMFLNNPEFLDGTPHQIERLPEIDASHNGETTLNLEQTSALPDLSLTSSSVITPMGASTTSAQLSTNSDINEELSKENLLLKNELRSAKFEVSTLLQRAKNAEKSCNDLQMKIEHLETIARNVSRLEEEITAVQQRAEASDNLILKKNDPDLIADLQKQLETVTLEKENAEKHYLVCHNEVKQLEIRCDKLRKERRDAVNELEHYRTRAQGVLQEKERIIADLRTINSGSSASLGSAGSDSLLDDSPEKEIRRLLQDNEFLREENLQVTVQLQASREEVFELEKKLDTYKEQAANLEQKLQAELLEERRRRQAAEDDARNHAEELRCIQGEMSRQRNLMTNRVRERELELTRLRAQLAQRPASATDDELEHRLHTLTQTLVQKQTCLETVTTERNALRLQLEKLEDKYRHVTSLLQQFQSSQAAVNDTDDGKTSQVPALFIESPFDTGISLRVKRAYSTLDAVSIRTGVFLRRYPLARILVFSYMILLHLWVVFVLLSYTPSPQ